MSRRISRPRKPFPGEFLTPWQLDGLRARASLVQLESQMWADGTLTYRTATLTTDGRMIVHDIT